MAGQEASTKTLCPSQTAAGGPPRGPRRPCAHSPLTARPVAWSPTPGECGTCGTEVRKRGGDLPAHTVVPAATGPGSSKCASSPSSTPPTPPPTGRGNIPGPIALSGHSPRRARRFVSGLRFLAASAETEILITAASTEKMGQVVGERKRGPVLVSTSQVTQHMQAPALGTCRGGRGRQPPATSALFKTWEAWRSGHGFSQAFTSSTECLTKQRQKS